MRVVLLKTGEWLDRAGSLTSDSRREKMLAPSMNGIIVREVESNSIRVPEKEEGGSRYRG